jgi:hypothetical protein
MRRSAGVTAIATISLAGSALALFLGVLFAAAPLLAGVRNRIVALGFKYAVLGLWACSPASASSG